MRYFLPAITIACYRQKTDITPNPAIASPPATNDRIPSPPPIPATVTPPMIVSASPTRLWLLIITPKRLSYFMFESGYYSDWMIINVKLA